MSSIAHLKDRFTKLPTYAGLTAGQVAFADAVFAGQNVLISGAAGVGKTYVSKMVLDFLVKHEVSVGKTAMTGVAALNIGGSTIHSFAGLGLADKDVGSMIADIRKNKRAKGRIESCKVLVIDEVSMMKADLMDKLDTILKYYRYSSRPFGGCQLILSADFLQLPPIWGSDKKREFAFQSRAWNEASIVVVNLTEIVRQQGDPEFARALNQIRIGDPTGLALIRTRVGAKLSGKGAAEPVRIYCKNVDVDAMNDDKLRSLPGDAKMFSATDTGTEYYEKTLDKHCLAPKQLFLKIGAQVMLLRNMEGSLVNGSIGVVRQLSNSGPTVEFKGGDHVKIEPVTWEVKEQLAKNEKDPKNSKIVYKTVASRTQYPLKLAYAITAHKVQGLTLDSALIDMSEAFSEGQIYVSLSRVRSLDSLSIVDFPDSKLKVNEECLEFYRNIGANPVPAMIQPVISVPPKKSGLSGGTHGGDHKPRRDQSDFIHESDAKDFTTL